MKKLVPVLTAILVLMVILACGFAPRPTETPRPSKPAATKAPAPTATSTPKPTNTATPAPTPTGAPEVNFSVDRTQIKQGECVTFSWKVENVKAVYYYREGDRWQNHGVAGQGSQQECPPSSTAFYLRVVKPDESIDLRQIVITVEPTPTATSAFDPLGGTRWRVQSYRDPASAGSLSPVLTGTTLTVDFGRDGKVSGSAGCNTYSSTYVVQGNLLAITLPTATNKLCTEPQGIMEQETAFVALLPTIGSYSISGSQLTLKSASGQIVVELEAY
ncbi:MAG TPA: META domain-containing protein [Anaerolineae bacterium]|nr:META domain-containing protein [Anaerolineae bacterium]